jgi:endonuclease YncB( thermonuclease family)
VIAALLIAATAALAQGRLIIGVASVIDGDTIEIHGERIRLFGIDAPESRQECRRPDGSLWRCGQQAALALQEHIGRRPIMCEQRDIDRYHRTVAQCRLAAEDVNAWLVASGWAVAFTRYSRDYVEQEQQARAARRGIWSGDFVMPWDWRRGERLDQ